MRRLLFVVVVSAVAGCNAILGIDKFDDAPCAPCTDASLGDIAIPDSPSREADVADVEVEAGAIFDASDADAEVIPLTRFWARWPMPTGEALSDGAAPYADASGALQDSVTGLTWQPALHAAKSYDEARQACEGEGWRVPTRIELVTLMDVARDAGPLWNEAFGVDAGGTLRMWTASRFRGSADQHWIIATDGVISHSGDGTVVRCVRLP